MLPRSTAVVSDIGVQAAKTGMLAPSRDHRSGRCAIVECTPDSRIWSSIRDGRQGRRHAAPRRRGSRRCASGFSRWPRSITPNLPEAEVMLGRRDQVDRRAREAARDLVALGRARRRGQGRPRGGEATRRTSSGTGPKWSRFLAAADPDHEHPRQRVRLLGRNRRGAGARGGTPRGSAAGQEVHHRRDRALARDREGSWARQPLLLAAEGILEVQPLSCRHAQIQEEQPTPSATRIRRTPTRTTQPRTRGWPM